MLLQFSKHYSVHFRLLPTTPNLMYLTFPPRLSSSTPLASSSPHDNTLLLPEYNDPIILPPVLPHHLLIPNHKKLIGRGLPNFQECLATLHALIQQAKMDRAERLHANLRIKHPSLMTYVMDTNVYNVFIDGWMSRINVISTLPGKRFAVQAGLKWFLKINKESPKSKPDASSYAYLLRGLLRADLFDQVTIYLAQAQRADSSGSLVREIVQHSALSNLLDVHLVPKWKNILNEAGIAFPGSVSDIHEDGDHQHTTDTNSTESPELTKLYADQLGLPMARPVGSVGLSLLQKNLRVIQEHSAIKDSSFGKYALQLKLEDAAYDVAIQKLKNEQEACQNGRSIFVPNTKSLNAAMWQWHLLLTDAIQKELDECRHATDPGSGPRSLYAPFLTQLPAQKLAIITISELLRLHIPYKGFDEENNHKIPLNKLTRVAITLGVAVENEIRAENLRSKMRSVGQEPGVLSQMDKRIKRLNDSLFDSQRIFNITARRLGAQIQGCDKSFDGDDISENTVPEDLSGGNWLSTWPQCSHARVGSVLLSLILDVAKVTREVVDPGTGVPKKEQVPAFYQSIIWIQGKRVGVLKFHPLVSQMLSSEPVGALLSATFLPMIVRPRAWLTYKSGGYLTTRSMCMRIKGRSVEQTSYLRAAAKHNRINSVLVALDVLGSIAWKVNLAVFEVALQAWNSGEQFADFPPDINDGNRHKFAPVEPSDTSDKEKYRAYKVKMDEYKHFVRNSYSQRCEINYKIEIARTFLDQEMYFPHVMDFRGRAYPLPSYLNHMSSDLCRGLLSFAESKPLGERGWFWLKVHMASLHGIDKVSFIEREKWVMNHMEDIMDSAKNPMTGQRWWLKAGDPWQCLATCFEISKAVQSGDPTTFLSNLPVHQDGSCNGLQHYAALGRDATGAQHVNLAKSEYPADVYTHVAKIASQAADKDALAGNKIASQVRGHINRKVVKQTVMTNVYGVTLAGAQRQVENRLKESKLFEDTNLFPLANYISKEIAVAIGTTFNTAQQFQKWLNLCASLIAKSVVRKYADQDTGNMTTVVWTTPLGLTCVQPYRVFSTVMIPTVLQQITISDPNNPSPVDTSRQRSAFPPNFIHSLDASHMMMTAAECRRAGLTFAAVHDSFWTHACDVDEMNRIIRQEFVHLHSQPILENLLKEFKIRYRDHVIHRKWLKKAMNSFKGFNDTEDDDIESSGQCSDDESALNAASTLAKRARKSSNADDAIDQDEEMNISSKWVPLEFPPLPKRGTFDLEIREPKPSCL